MIQVTDEAKAATGFGKLVGLLQSEGDLDAKPIKIDGADAAFAVQDGTTPKPIVFARGNGKVIIAYGDEAAADALAPADKLGDAEIYGQAKDALEGDVEPGLLLSMPAVIALVDSSRRHRRELGRGQAVPGGVRRDRTRRRGRARGARRCGSPPG